MHSVEHSTDVCEWTSDYSIENLVPPQDFPNETSTNLFSIYGGTFNLLKISNQKQKIPQKQRPK